ncbi:lysin A [Microbacterium phage Pickles13]|nr:lysin A [Microbacterium phage Pickles13]
MADGWVYRDGQRLTPAMLHDFLALDADFARRTGEHLKISSGIRTDAEQERIWYDRMVLAHQVNGRRVYETRWWDGRLWYRISSAGTVAPPRQSNHQIGGGRKGALDIYDTGRDAGVLTRGSFRANVFDAIAPSYGYDSEGYGFGETWHKRYNRDPWRAVPTGGGSTVAAPKESDNVQSIMTPNGRQYGIDTEFLTHYGNVPQAEITRRVSSATDELHKISLADLPNLLDGYGIPRSVLNASGDVLNPQANDNAGAYEYNGTWSRRREMLAAEARNAAAIAALDKKVSALGATKTA